MRFSRVILLPLFSLSLFSCAENQCTPVVERACSDLRAKAQQSSEIPTVDVLCSQVSWGGSPCSGGKCEPVVTSLCSELSVQASAFDEEKRKEAEIAASQAAAALEALPKGQKPPEPATTQAVVPPPVVTADELCKRITWDDQNPQMSFLRNKCSGELARGEVSSQKPAVSSGVAAAVCTGLKKELLALQAEEKYSPPQPLVQAMCTGEKVKARLATHPAKTPLEFSLHVCEGIKLEVLTATPEELNECHVSEEAYLAKAEKKKEKQRFRFPKSEKAVEATTPAPSAPAPVVAPTPAPAVTTTPPVTPAP